MVVVGSGRAPAKVVVAGEDLSALDESGLARLRRHRHRDRVQSFHLLPTMTVRENVAILLELAGHLRDAFALAERGPRGSGSGSAWGISGTRRAASSRVAIPWAFVAGPALLLADEPTGNLDRATGAGAHR